MAPITTQTGKTLYVSRIIELPAPVKSIKPIYAKIDVLSSMNRTH
jgi:hypothetical protein